MDELILRKYQTDIIKTCLNENSLVVLGTGLGKTAIAIEVAKNRLNKYPTSNVLILAPTKPLVQQHKETFIKYLNTVILDGSINHKERMPYYDLKGQVIISTPQTSESDLKQGLKLDNFSLIVFDEAHRAIQDYSYTYIADKYKDFSSGLILGLSASPGGNLEKINEVCNNLFISNIQSRTRDDPDVKPYIKDTFIKTKFIQLPNEFDNVLSNINNLLDENIRTLGRLGYPIESKSKGELLKLQKKISAMIGEGQNLYGHASILAKIIKLNYAKELIETQGVSQFVNYMSSITKQESKASKALTFDPRFIEALNDARLLVSSGVDHPKLKIVNDLCNEYYNDNNNVKILIFTKYRETVDKISKTLKVKNCKLIGQAKEGMKQKKQIEVLERFKSGEYTSMISTSIGEEGLHVPDVDLIIFYDIVSSAVSNIQRRGRCGRSKEGNVILLITSDTSEVGMYYSSIKKEKAMKDSILKINEQKLLFN